MIDGSYIFITTSMLLAIAIPVHQFALDARRHPLCGYFGSCAALHFFISSHGGGCIQIIIAVHIVMMMLASVAMFLLWKMLFFFVHSISSLD
jgi:hypothetical protein